MQDCFLWYTIPPWRYLAIKELDVVKIIEDFSGISAGTIGTIVLEYSGTHFEVEFVDENGATIDVVTTPSKLLELIEES